MRCFQRQAIQELHYDERMPIVLADFMNGADIRVVEGGGSLGFPLESAESLRVARYVVGKKFERDESVKVGVLCFVDDTHSSAAQSLDNAIMRNGFANHRAEILWREVAQVNPHAGCIGQRI